MREFCENQLFLNNIILNRNWYRLLFSGNVADVPKLFLIVLLAKFDTALCLEV